MCKSKVICIGWHKTGTSTMGDALLTLGYDVLGARLDLAEPLFEGDVEKVFEAAKPYDALQDVPWAAIFKELDLAFPGSKFILTERAPDAWLHSAKKHFKDTHIPLHEYLYGKGILIGNEALYLNRYKRHNKEVKAYFQNRPNDLLIMNLKSGDGWEKLCPFLGHDVPKKSFPYSNKGKHNYTLKDRAKHLLRSVIPNPIRRARVELLESLGLHKGRNRFNNAGENKKERLQRIKKQK